MAINFYSASKAYSLSAAFVTKYIHNYEEFSSLANNAATLDGYYVIANSFEANNETAMGTWTQYASTTSTGFIGILDGRNHVISNLKLANYLIGSLGAGTIRDIAFVNVTQESASGGGKFLINESHGSTLRNVYISCTTSGTVFASAWHSPTFENVVYVTANLDGGQNYGLTWTGNTGTMTITNAIVVTPYSKGYYWAGTTSTDNVVSYASQDAMMAALTETTFDGWNSPFTFENGALKFGGTTVIAAA